MSKSKINKLLLVGVILIGLSFVLPWWRENIDFPISPLKELSYICKYLILNIEELPRTEPNSAVFSFEPLGVIFCFGLTIYHLFTALIIILSIYKKSKPAAGNYWIALSMAFLSFYTHLLFVGLSSTIFSRSIGMSVLGIGQIIILIGLILYQVQKFQSRHCIDLPRKYIIFPGVSILTFLAGSVGSIILCLVVIIALYLIINIMSIIAFPLES